MLLNTRCVPEAHSTMGQLDKPPSAETRPRQGPRLGLHISDKALNCSLLYIFLKIKITEEELGLSGLLPPGAEKVGWP